MGFYIDTVAIDYLSLTTFSHFDFISIAGALENMYDGGLEQCRRMQYSGTKYSSDSGSVFWGIGMIGEREHHMIQASGMLAQEVAETCHEWGFSTMSKKNEWSCKRLDIQLTIEAKTLSAPDLRITINGARWPKKIPRKLTLISSDTDTLYIGSRASAVMFRIYQKTDRYVRLELELKKEVAKTAWQYFIDNCKNAHDMRNTSRLVLLHEVRNLPDISYLRAWRRKLGENGGIDVSTGERHKTDESKKLKWLFSLIPTMQRMCNDSDYGWKVRDVLQEVLDNTKPK